MRVVVTGAAGFIGSHLVDRLLKEGYRVVGIDNLSTGSLDNLRNALGYTSFKLVRADLLQPNTWIKEYKDASIVFHFAANPEVRHSVGEPLEHYHQNLTATMHVLEASRRHGVETVVYASSSTVYGDPEIIPTREDHPLKPISVYGATKAAGEILVETYSRLYGIRGLNLRYANIVGPRLRHGVIYDFIMKLVEDDKRLEVLGDGTQRKSYLHVSEAVDATLAVLETLLGSGKSSETYNIGNYDWVTVGEIARIVIEAMGLENVEINFKPVTRDGRGWPGDVKLMLLDISKIKEDAGWEPRMNSREAVETTAKQLVAELVER